MRHVTTTFLYAALALMLSAEALAQAGTEVRVRESSNRNMADVQGDHYNGPKARIAVARFENKSADARNWWNPQIGDGMADMLTTALVRSGRYIVLERQNLDTVLDEQDLGASGRVRQDTAAAVGEIEGAELLVVAAVTEFEGNAGGTRAGGGGIGGRVFGAIAGGSRKAHMAIDLRVVDARTSRILAATSVEGEAKDFDIGGALGGWTGSVGLGGALSTWENTPREKALRAVIEASVDYVISVTPASMLRYDAMGNPVQAASSGGSGTTPRSGGTAAPAASGTDERVVTTVATRAFEGPSQESSVKFDVGSGKIMDVMARAGGWVQVRDDQGRTGWVDARGTLTVE